MATEYLPPLTDIEPSITAIRQRVRAYNRGEVTGLPRARLEFMTHNNILDTLNVTFGRYAIFLCGDIAFEFKGEHDESQTGILLKVEDNFYVSTPFLFQDRGLKQILSSDQADQASNRE